MSQSQKPSNPKDAVGIRKAPLSVVPMNVVAELGVAMMEGALKYGRHNYRGVGVRSSVYFDAAMRHLIAYWEGEDIDPDSGLSHITKAMASLSVWRDAQLQGKCEDDRPPRSEPFYGILNALADQQLTRHADKSPKHWTIADEEARDDFPVGGGAPSAALSAPGEDGQPIPCGDPRQLVFGSTFGPLGGVEVLPVTPQIRKHPPKPLRSADALAESETGGGTESCGDSGLPRRRRSQYWRDMAYRALHKRDLLSDDGS